MKMKKITRILAMLITAVTAMSMLAVGVSAKQLTIRPYGDEVTVDSSDVKTIKSKTEYSGDTSETLYNLYKLTVSKEGKVQVDYTTEGNNTNIFLFDSEGYKVEYYNSSIQSGWLEQANGHDHVYARRDRGKFTGSFSYSVEKGTYYFAVVPGSTNQKNGGKYKFTATFPQASTSDAKTSLSGDIKYLSLTMAEGDSFTLAAVGTSNNAKVQYTSSDTSVVTVSSKGKIKAKNPGNADITVKCGKDTLVIKVKVTE